MILLWYLSFHLNTLTYAFIEHNTMLMGGRPSHPLRNRVVYMMRRGLATVAEISAAGDITRNTINTWRRRAGHINTKATRAKRVRTLLFSPRMGK